MTIILENPPAINMNGRKHIVALEAIIKEQQTALAEYAYRLDDANRRLARWRTRYHGLQKKNKQWRARYHRRRRYGRTA